MSVWETLSKVNVNGHTEKKGNLTYLSWAWAWGELKSLYPSAQYEKHYFDHCGMQLPYTLDAKGHAFVMVSVTVEGLTHTETMPVLDHKNKAVKEPDSFQVNTSLQRCLAKAIAMHGLGHYIYAGEDLPTEGSAIQEDTLKVFANRMLQALQDDENGFLIIGRSQIDDKDLWEATNNSTRANGGYYTANEKTRFGEMGTKYRDFIREYAGQIEECIGADDTGSVVELLDELGENSTDKKVLWKNLSDKAHMIIKGLKRLHERSKQGDTGRAAGSGSRSSEPTQRWRGLQHQPGNVRELEGQKHRGKAGAHGVAQGHVLPATCRDCGAVPQKRLSGLHRGQTPDAAVGEGRTEALHHGNRRGSDADAGFQGRGFRAEERAPPRRRNRCLCSG